MTEALWSEAQAGEAFWTPTERAPNFMRCSPTQATVSRLNTEIVMTLLEMGPGPTRQVYTLLSKDEAGNPTLEGSVSNASSPSITEVGQARFPLKTAIQTAIFMLRHARELDEDLLQSEIAELMPEMSLGARVEP